MSVRHPRRWLALAARQRLWQVEERLPELALCAAEQERAEHAQNVAEGQVAQLQAERAALLARPFGATALKHHVDYDAFARLRAATARAAAERARDEAVRVRTEAQRLLAERDACVERLESLEARERQGAARRETRALDELWLATPLRAARGREDDKP